MSKRKELIICLISVAVLLIAIATNVFATEIDLSSLVGNTENTENNYQEIGTVNNTNTDTNTNTNVNINTNTNTNTNINRTISENTNTTSNTKDGMPYTGVNYSVVVIIAVCGVSAIYAYKKIKEYNV